MLRLSLLLCIGMYAALMIAGEDRGQLRPGLAAAAAKGVQPEAVSGADSASATASLADQVDESPATVAATAPVEALAAADPAPVLAAAPADPSATAYVEPERELVTALEEPVFSLASIGNEPVQGEEARDTTASPEVPDGGEGTIWYVTANSVNVRAEPSTEADVVGKLASGEATLVVQAVSEDWARIVIQGDGVEGFVAMRYLSAEAP